MRPSLSLLERTIPGCVGVALSCAIGLAVTGCGGATRERPAPVVAVPSVPPAACPRKPDVAVNPPVPSGWIQVKDSSVTPEMSAWAREVVMNPRAYPMCSSTAQTFGGATFLARVEWHPPDFNVATVHRGVTLYERDPRPLGAALHLAGR